MSKGNSGAESYLELKSAFSRVDKKKTGKIDVKQFKDLIINLAGDDHRYIMREVEPFIPDIFVLLDADEDGKLSERELCSLAMYGSTSELKQLMQIVMMYASDKDGNGWISTAELREMLLKNGFREDDADDSVKQLMMMISIDDLTKVSIDAAVEFFCKGGKDDRIAHFKLMFNMIDVNKDRTITKTELRKYFGSEGCRLREPVLKEMIKEAEKAEDEKLSFSDFCTLLEKL